jgi:hypothetical protein
MTKSTDLVTIAVTLEARRLANKLKAEWDLSQYEAVEKALAEALDRELERQQHRAQQRQVIADAVERLVERPESE